MPYLSLLMWGMPHYFSSDLYSETYDKEARLDEQNAYHDLLRFLYEMKAITSNK